MIRPAALVTALAVLAGCGSAHHQASPPSRVTAPVATPTRASAAAGVTARIGAWGAGPGGAAFRHLDTALNQAARAGTSGNLAAFGAACSKVASAVTAAEGDPAIPSVRASRWYVRALAQFQKGSADCQAGAPSGDAAMLRQAAAAISAGSTDLARATATMKALGS